MRRSSLYEVYKVSLAKVVKILLEFRCLPHETRLVKFTEYIRWQEAGNFLKTCIVYSMNSIVIFE